MALTNCVFLLLLPFLRNSFPQDKPKHFIMKRFQNVKGKFEQEREQQAAKLGRSGGGGAGEGTGGEERREYSDEEY